MLKVAYTNLTMQFMMMSHFTLKFTHAINNMKRFYSKIMVFKIIKKLLIIYLILLLRKIP